MSTHPSSPGQVAAEKLLDQRASLPAAGEEWKPYKEVCIELPDGDVVTCWGEDCRDTLLQAHNVTLRRTQPVQGLEQIAREWAAKVNRNGQSIEFVELLFLRACQAAASAALKNTK